MTHTATLAIILIVGATSQATACALPPPVCQVSDGQRATLEHFDGTTVLFSQQDVEASNDAPTYVLVDCNRRQAVALGHLPSGTDHTTFQSHLEGRRLMDHEVSTRRRPRLGRVHRQLQRMGLRSKRFTLMKSHCGCTLPDIPPPPANCPTY